MTESNTELIKRKIVTVALLILTGLLLVLCYKILEPFFPVFSWAVALSVLGFPLYYRISGRVTNQTVAAVLAVTAISILIIVPAFFVLRQITTEITTNFDTFAEVIEGDKLVDAMEGNRQLKKVVLWAQRNLDLKKTKEEILTRINNLIPTFFATSVWSVFQLFIILFTLFYLFRDRHKVLNELKGLVPLSDRESHYIFSKISDTIYATLYGAGIVAAIQGTLGGLMFWFLDLPAPVTWGVVMAFLALIPYLGAFVVWMPAAAYLAISGHTTDALILTIWGGTVIALIDNLIYPMLVGQKLRFHTLPVFFFLLGGVAFFGISGIILGPLTLAVADALLDTWKQRLQGINGSHLKEEKVAL